MILSNEKIQNSSSQPNEIYLDTVARTPLSQVATNLEINLSTQELSVHGEESILPHYMCNQQSQLDDALQNTDTRSEYHPKLSRREGRRLRRRSSRLLKKVERSHNIGTLEDVFSYDKLYFAGKRCCKGVRWKSSVQNFESQLFSRTAVNHNNLVNNNYKLSTYFHFKLNERGKIRDIDAPKIDDRQVEKVLSNEVLLPLYLPSMIYNNGASLKGKGFQFSQNQLRKELYYHIRKYGRQGGIILSDGKQFFPSADHQIILNRHKEYILNQDLRDFADKVTLSSPTSIGIPLGVEPSQSEMIAYPSKMDNYMKCQLGLKGYGHYMDDFYAIVPPDKNWKDIMNKMIELAKSCGFELNKSKTRYIPFTKSFRYCKIRYKILDNGKIIRKGNKSSVPKAIHKLKSFKSHNYELSRVIPSANGILAYLENYNEHNQELRIKRLLYKYYKLTYKKNKAYLYGCPISI